MRHEGREASVARVGLTVVTTESTTTTCGGCIGLEANAAGVPHRTAGLFSRMCFKVVVLPAPRKPERTVTERGFSVPLAASRTASMGFIGWTGAMDRGSKGEKVKILSDFFSITVLCYHSMRTPFPNQSPYP